jgi:hypothetical protein
MASSFDKIHARIAACIDKKAFTKEDADFIRYNHGTQWQQDEIDELKTLQQLDFYQKCADGQNPNDWKVAKMYVDAVVKAGPDSKIAHAFSRGWEQVVTVGGLLVGSRAKEIMDSARTTSTPAAADPAGALKAAEDKASSEAKGVVQAVKSNPKGLAILGAVAAGVAALGAGYAYARFGDED